MSLIDIVRNNPDLSDEEILIECNSKNIEKCNSEKQTFNTLTLTLGVPTIVELTARLKAATANPTIGPFIEQVYMTIANNGIDLSQNVAQEQLDQMFAMGILTDELRTSLKQIGIKKISPTEAERGIGALETLENITAARAEIAKQNTKTWLSQRFEQASDAIRDGELDRTVLAAIFAQ